MSRMYFADNQSKQKAYDQYYNAMAKSHFKQGRKLRALIRQEAEAEALTEQMAKLYASSAAKNHEYEYDEITKKLRGKVEKPKDQIKEAEAKSKAKAKAKAETKAPATPATAPRRTRRASVEFVNHLETDTFVRNEIEKLRKQEFKTTNNPADDYQRIKKKVKNYINKDQKSKRQGQFDTKRVVLNKADANEAVDLITDRIVQGARRNLDADMDDAAAGNVDEYTQQVWRNQHSTERLQALNTDQSFLIALASEASVSEQPDR